MLIVIPGCEAHLDRKKAIDETWGKDCVSIFFTGEMLGVPDDYFHLPQKVRAICQWCNRFDAIFKCDSDTYIHTDRLRGGRGQWDYVGHRLDGKDYASGGAGYWLSNRAINIIAEHDPRNWQNEDEMVGAVLAKRGIKLHHDPRYTLALDSWPEPGNDIITKHLSMNGPYKVEMMYAAHKRAHP